MVAQEIQGSKKTLSTFIGGDCCSHRSLHMRSCPSSQNQFVTWEVSETLQYITALLQTVLV